MAHTMPDATQEQDEAPPYDTVKLARIRSHWPVYAEDEI